MKNTGFIAPPAPDSEVLFAEATLWAGDIVADKTPVRMSTVLGSCVSVCLYDPAKRWGGMNHFLVPKGGTAPIHGDWAVAHLVERMHELGSPARSLQAKIFGGGSPLRLANEEYAVGSANVAVARHVLASYNIPIIAERVEHGGAVSYRFDIRMQGEGETVFFDV